MIKFFKNFKKKTYNTKDSDIQFTNDLTDLYNNFFSRIDPKNWDQLIHDASNNYNWYMEIISDKLLHFLMDNYNLPYEVWILLNEHFQWSNGDKELCKLYPKTFVQFVLSNINHEYKLRYALFRSKINGSYDDFINLYYRAYFELKNKNFYVTRKLILQTKQIFAEHPDLIILEGSYYLQVNKIANALEKFSYVINMDNNDFYAHLNRADTYIRIGELLKAYEDYKECSILDPHNINLQYQFGNCCLYMGEYHEAKDIYNKILAKYSDDKLIMQNLNSADNFLKEEI